MITLAVIAFVAAIFAALLNSNAGFFTGMAVCLGSLVVRFLP